MHCNSTSNNSGGSGCSYVRVWPTLTIVDTGPTIAASVFPRRLDQQKGRLTQHQQAVKISTDPTSFGAKHGYRKFVRVGLDWRGGLGEYVPYAGAHRCCAVQETCSILRPTSVAL